MTDFVQQIEGLRRYAHHLTRDRSAAEDLVQDCLVSAIAGAHTLRPGAPLRPWLFRIMYVNHVAGWRRRRRSPVDDVGENLPETAVDGGQDRSLELSETLRALDTLPQVQRDAIALIALEDMSYEQAASVLGIPVGTLMSRLSRGRANLRRAMENDGQPTLRIVASEGA